MMRDHKTVRRIDLGRASKTTKGTGGFHMETQGAWAKSGLGDR